MNKMDETIKEDIREAVISYFENRLIGDISLKGDYVNLHPTYEIIENSPEVSELLRKNDKGLNQGKIVLREVLEELVSEKKLKKRIVTKKEWQELYKLIKRRYKVSFSEEHKIPQKPIDWDLNEESETYGYYRDYNIILKEVRKIIEEE